MLTTGLMLAFGPAHPAAHGVLRCMLVMQGEWVIGATITLGLLHRGTEKLIELRHAMQTSCFASLAVTSSIACYAGWSMSRHTTIRGALLH